MRRSNLLKVANEAILDKDVTYSIVTGLLNPDFGYLVPIRGRKETSEYIDKDVIARYVKRHSHHLRKPEAFLRIFEADGQYVLDTYDLHELKRNAYFWAIVRGQSTIHDNEKKDDIKIKIS